MLLTAALLLLLFQEYRHRKEVAVYRRVSNELLEILSRLVP